jgi:catechol 2,3-dioxygenase-like lactoylglutathione lyase family enzyme
MIEGPVPGLDQRRVQEFLRSLGADRLAHPGGTLYQHLCRVAALLRGWGADQEVQAAGLCHACYGTDGYPQALLGLDDRARLVDQIGARAEYLVYLYASCDRTVVYPQLGASGPVRFRDRFTDSTVTPPEGELRAFLELTAANELDVARHNPALAAEHGADLLELFTRVRDRLSAPAWGAWVEALGGHRDRGPTAGIAVSGLDHLVLTVADLDRTLGFYQRLGLRPVRFGGGRYALAFGSSKINLHQAGRELTPHAARPTLGSADICLVTSTPPEQVLAALAVAGIPVEAGPTARTGALGPMTSVYVRDPDGNLVELAHYPNQPAPVTGADGR